MHQPYWTNTSSNEVVRHLIAHADEQTNAQLTSVAEGGCVDAPLDLSIVFGQIDSDTSAIWPQLYLAGYVTTHDVSEPNNAGLVRRLVVPNLEVRQLFSRRLQERAVSAAGSRHVLARLHTALVTGSDDSVAYELENALLNSISYYDLHNENISNLAFKRPITTTPPRSALGQSSSYFLYRRTHPFGRAYDGKALGVGTIVIEESRIEFVLAIWVKNAQQKRCRVTVNYRI